MSNLTDFFPSGGGGGLKPKFQEFTSSGTFTPSQALIDAGGYIEVFLVGGGETGNTNGTVGGTGGEVLVKKMYLTSTSDILITIGAGGSGGTSVDGSASSFNGSSAGGYDITALGGANGGFVYDRQSSWGAETDNSAAQGLLMYGAGGADNANRGGIVRPKPNSGSGSSGSFDAGSGYCQINWYE